MGKRVSSMNSVGKTGQLQCESIKQDILLISHTQINSKWTKDLNARTEIIKLLEEDIGSMLFDISLSNIFLHLSPQARATKAKPSKWDHINLKSCCAAKETINKTKRQPTEWEKIFANNMTDKGLI